MRDSPELAAVLREVERLFDEGGRVQPLFAAWRSYQAAERELAGTRLDEVSGGNPGCLSVDDDPDGGFLDDGALSYTEAAKLEATP